MNDEIKDKFSQAQRSSTDQLELGKDKQLLDYTMLAKFPDRLKAQIATTLRESHKVNATTTVEADKLESRCFPSAHLFA